MAHARLGPSNKRWPKCPGSIREEAAYPDTTSPAAIDGTGSHLLLEACLIHGVRAEAYLGQTIGVDDEENPMGWFIQQDRVDRVQSCLDYVEQRIYELGMQYDKEDDPCTVTVTAETISNPGEAYGRDDWWGTCDITIVVKDSKDDIIFVEVIDYKDGRRYVSEKFNTQLISYLHGKTFGLITCYTGMMTIFQPKTKTPQRSQLINIVDLQAEADKLAAAAILTDAPDAPLTPGKHCNEFCSHKKNCSARKNQIIEENDMTDSIIGHMGIIEQVMNHLPSMVPVDLAKILSVEKAYKDAFKDARAEAVRRISTGHDVPGFTLAPGKATRVWNEEEKVMVKKFKAMKLTQSDYYPATLLSPSGAEKLDKLTEVQKKNMQKLITTVAGKDTLKAVYIPEQPSAEQMLQGTEGPDLAAIASGVAAIDASEALAANQKALENQPAEAPAADAPISFM